MARTTHTLVPTGKLGALSTLHKAPFLVLDTSSSMSYPIEGGFRRIDRLREIVATLHQKGADFRQIVFSDSPRESTTVPDPYGGTDLASALAMALDNYATKIAVVSDGEPNSEQGAMAQAQRAKSMGVVIDVMFCGQPGTRGESFLKELAEATGGRGETVDFGDEPDQLTAGAMLMLGDGSEEAPKGPIIL